MAASSDLLQNKVSSRRRLEAAYAFTAEELVLGCVALMYCREECDHDMRFI